MKNKYYSIARALSQAVRNEKIEGYELEMHQEGVKEARTLGLTVPTGGFGFIIPSTVLNQRAILMSAEPELTGDQGLSWIEMLKAKLVLRKLGAKTITGLSNNAKIPRMTTGVTSGWYLEHEAVDENTPQLDTIEPTPHRLGTYCRVSRASLLSSVPGLEQFIIDEMLASVARKVEHAAIAGSGTDPEPLGILSTPGIGSVMLGENGEVPSYDSLIKLLLKVSTENADFGNLGFLTNHKAAAKLALTRTDAGAGIFALNMDSLINRDNFQISTQVPSNLTKGTGSNLSALIYGNFADLVICQWGGLAVTVDPYTDAVAGYVRLIINSYWDVAIRHEQSFAAISDMVTTI